LAIGLQPVYLDECAGELLGLPRCGGLAGAEANHHILDPHRLARPHPEVANDSVALVQEPDHRDPPGHRGNARLFGGSARHIDGDQLIAFLDLLRTIAARCRQQRKSQKGAELLHAYSGFQAS
jgi:hypothetical protein